MISDRWRRIIREYVIVVSIVLFTAVANWLFPYYYALKSDVQSAGPDFESFGGPVADDLSTGYQEGLVSISDADSGNLDFVSSGIVDGSSMLDVPNPLSVVISRDGVILYKVKEGDTLSAIASEFGVSLNTLLWANVFSLSVDTSLQPGQELVVLPVSGVIHQVREGEDLATIASLYGVSPQLIDKFNKGVGYEPGKGIIIPGGKPLKKPAISLSDLGDYFIMPAEGLNRGGLHYDNAVDISNICGTPIVAAAEGVVERVRTGYNSGYGTYILIRHPNDTIDKLHTLYAHLNKVTVSEGEYVFPGVKIGEIGNTGKTHGPTGCHLHFEVHGAKNPFAK